MKKLTDYISNFNKPRIGDSVVISVNNEYVIESKITDVTDGIAIVMDAATNEVLKHAIANEAKGKTVVDFDRIGRYSKWGRALLNVLKYSHNPKVMDKHQTGNDIVLIIQDHILNQILEKEGTGVTSNQIALYAKAIPELDYQWAPKSKQHVITIPKDLKLAAFPGIKEVSESQLTFENGNWHLKYQTTKTVASIVSETKQHFKEVLSEAKVGKMPLNYWEANPGSVYTADKYYDMYRASMIIARLPEDPKDIDPWSWINNSPMMVTYTPEEYEMAKKAFGFMGIPFGQHVPPGSDEPDAVNKVSPTTSFKGYKGAQRRSK